MAVTEERVMKESKGIRIKRKAQVTIPKKIMDTLRLKENDELDIFIEGNSIVMRPTVRIDRDQAWFWTEEWQGQEQEADQDIKSGRITAFNSAEEAAKYLDRLRKKNCE